MDDDRTLDSWREPATREAGDEQTASVDDVFLRCYEEHYSHLYCYICSQWRISAEDALDVTQEVFVKLYEKLGESGAAAIANPRAWLYTAARHELINRKKKQGIITKGQADTVRGLYGAIRASLTVEDSYIAAEQERDAMKVLGSMDEEDRKSVYAWSAGITLRDIGAGRGMDFRRAHELVYSLLARIRKVLRG